MWHQAPGRSYGQGLFYFVCSIGHRSYASKTLISFGRQELACQRPCREAIPPALWPAAAAHVKAVPLHKHGIHQAAPEIRRASAIVANHDVLGVLARSRLVISGTGEIVWHSKSCQQQEAPQDEQGGNGQGNKPDWSKRCSATVATSKSQSSREKLKATAAALNGLQRHMQKKLEGGREVENGHCSVPPIASPLDVSA
jgi:hypothetical protein